MKRQPYKLRCKYCHQVFYSLNFKRKCCSNKCADVAIGIPKFGDSKLDKDPSQAEIADLCAQIRAGKLVIGSQKDVGPNWFMQRKR